MAVSDPGDDRRQLARIADALDIPLTAFQPSPALPDTAPSRRECAELVLLFKRVGAANRRATIMAVLRAMSHASEAPHATVAPDRQAATRSAAPATPDRTNRSRPSQTGVSPRRVKS